MYPFERRIYLGILGVILSFVPILAITFFSIHQIIKDQRELVSVNSKQLFAVEKLIYIDTTLSAVMPVYVLTGDAAMLRGFDQRYEDFDNALAELEQVQDNGDFHEDISRIKSLSQQLRKLAKPGIDLRRRGASIDEVHAYFKNNTVHLSQELREILKGLSREESKQLEAAQEHFSRTVDWVIGLMLLFSGVTLLLIALIGRLIVKTLRQKHIYDKTQLKLFEQEKQLSQARKEAVEVVAHDLKNPLGSVKMSVEMVLGEIAGDKSNPLIREGLEIAQRSTDSMERLIKDLLDHSKIESGKLVLEKRECDVNSLCRELVDRYEVLAKQKNISFSAKISPARNSVVCDSGRIEQVLSNLLGNALKFTSSGGRVYLRVDETRDEIRFLVEDTGVGLENHQIEHIFDRFWQVKETAKLGYGLGLSIVKAVVEAHEGRVWVESQKGVGSRFYFSLPREGKAHIPHSTEANAF